MSRIGQAAVALAILAASGVRAAPLATPPPGASELSIVSDTIRHGRTFRWTDARGVRWSRESLLERGMITEVDQAVALARDGTIQSFTERGRTPGGRRRRKLRTDRRKSRLALARRSGFQGRHGAGRILAVRRNL